MSWSDVVPLHANAQLRLGHYLLVAMMCCALAAPIGLLWTKLLATKTPPIEMAPVAEEPATDAPSSSRPAETVMREAPPSAALPQESATLESEPPTSVPAEVTPAEPLPQETPILPPALPEIPGIATAPSGGGLVPMEIPGGTRVARAGASAHAQVVALLKMLAHKKASTTKATPAIRGRTAREGMRGRSLNMTPPAASVTATTTAAPSLGGRAPGPGLLGGPAAHTGNVGLNGTAMRHRP